MPTSSSATFRCQAPLIVIGAPYNGPMRFLGIDPGGKRLGLALGDDVTGLATPLEVVPCASRDHAVGVIAAAMNTHYAEIAIIGLPTNAEGAPDSRLRPI